jgi:hypothetical protein
MRRAEVDGPAGELHHARKLAAHHLEHAAVKL